MESKKVKIAKKHAEMLNNMVPESMIRPYLTMTDPDVDPNEVVPEASGRPKFI